MPRRPHASEAFPSSPSWGIFATSICQGFRDFDYVLWNMPFFTDPTGTGSLQRNSFHDGDDGDILQSFLKRLPSLLKKDGRAILLNAKEAREIIDISLSQLNRTASAVELQSTRSKASLS